MAVEIIDMHRTLLLGGLTALALAAAGGAVAQQPQERPAQRAQRADADGDGRISQAEFVSRRVDRLAAVDADHDGSVTREEMQAAGRARMAQRADARFTRLDANGDGSISRAEFDASREARAARSPRPARMGMRAGGHRMARPARMDRRADRGPIVIADVRARTEQAFARLDADHDGFVTAEERRAGRQAVREQRRERRAERRAAVQAREASPQTPASE